MGPRAPRPDGSGPAGPGEGATSVPLDDEDALWAETTPEPARLGGVVHHDDGCELIWSIADGRRGRRTREVCARLGRPSAARLVESDPDGGLRRLEVSGPRGLLTLHPSEDGRTLHGNVVTSSGIRHLGLPWGSAHRVVVAGSIASVALACRHLETVLPPGGTTIFRGVGIDGDLQVSEGSVRIERVGLTGWQASVAEMGFTVIAEVDPRGVPVGGALWPLELPPER